ncbi:AbrB/MazE/SpoVT family DNA-binding domain-containing protein [Rivularia sp. UHCC 0363]|uniref:AbrB/MazE/SpoVT family DNA-binding domain-containing protein n=1 Tax=Rivularia sp. UHCC 0363 TaxID=3110244 RepID=UPI002B204293|nr:AbrB/MazE/SpoVT family DNA-binding domain-containing protein [Rivularia sp. UHCC 0363]MEA5593086.1 AbrB/MazE/SpoVT family DNA-binding domain-containing protein [Rivularia sp. UHCC 0363]
MNKLSIDEFGRVQLPSEVREQLGLTTEAQLKLEVQEGKIILMPISEQPRLYYQGDVLIVESEIIGNFDIIGDLREERIREHSNW